MIRRRCKRRLWRFIPQSLLDEVARLSYVFTRDQLAALFDRVHAGAGFRLNRSPHSRGAALVRQTKSPPVPEHILKRRGQSCFLM